MKTLTTLLIALIINTLTLSAAPKCERLAFYDLDNLKASFENDLVSNVWRTSILGTTATLYFQEDGLVIAVPSAPGKVETYTWALSVDEGRALLTFYSPSADKQFMIAPTCSGISMSTKGKTGSMFVTDDVRSSESELNFLLSQLTGSWHYQQGKSKKAYPAQFTLNLAADNTFRLYAGPDKYHSSSQGVWQLSPDGHYLILYTKVLIGNKEHYVPEAIGIKSVDFEDMVIEARTLPRALEAYSGKEPLFMSKARA